MKIIRRAEPLTEPVTLQAAKDHLRVLHAHEDVLIQALIGAARDYCENYCERAFASAEFSQLQGSFSTSMQLPIDAEVVSGIYYNDLDGVMQQIPNEDINFNPLNKMVKSESQWPQGTDVRIDFFQGPDPAASPPEAAPPSIIAAIMLTLGDLYANRETGIVGTIYANNPATERLLFHYRINLGV